MRPVCLLMIFLLFTLLNLIILLKINLLILFKEPLITFTLHLTTETHFFYFRKTKKNIMHGLVKMYVMRGQHFYSIWHQNA